MLTSTATGAGVIAGGVIIGVTGGLAAPAIAAVLAPLGISGLIGGAAAPVVLGTLFGVGGGGLAGRRVRERWKGVEEFSFIEVGAGTKATQEEVDELKAARERYKARDKSATKNSEDTIGTEQPSSEQSIAVVQKEVEKLHLSSGEERSEADQKEAAQEALAAAPEDEKVDEAVIAQQVEEDRLDLEGRLVELSAGSEDSSSRRGSLDAGRQSLEHEKEEKEVDQLKKPPSLTVRPAGSDLMGHSSYGRPRSSSPDCSPFRRPRHSRRGERSAPPTPPRRVSSRPSSMPRRTDSTKQRPPSSTRARSSGCTA